MTKNKDHTAAESRVNLSPVVSDQMTTTTCYMCACRCGIKVHLRDGAIRYIEGNRNHPVNRGVLCAKGSAGIMQQHSPAKLTKPLKRVGPRGSGEFQEIEWEEALGLATEWLGAIRKTDPRKLAFFTGRDQSQALTSWWAAQFGTPNYAAHGGFCSVNMAAAGLYSIGGSFWEFGEPDWDHARYFLMFGVAEDHDSNPIKIGLGKLRARGAKFVSVNPIKTGYSAIADEWLGIRPGSDGLFVGALIHELLKAGKIDFDYLMRYTNAPWLVIQDPAAADDGLFARDEAGRPLCWDKDRQSIADAMEPGASPALLGEFDLPDGRKATPAFALMTQRFLDPRYAPDAVAGQTDLTAATIRRIAAELAHAAFAQQIVLDVPWTDWTGRRHETMVGRPVAMHAMRGISAHSNGFHTCRAIHLLQMLLGTIDCPGGFRYKPPFPKPCPPANRPAGKPDKLAAETPLSGNPLGFVQGPEDLLLGADGTPGRIDKAYSWEAPFAAHGLMHMVIRNAWAGEPYPIDTLFLFMANMSWNSAMNTTETMHMLTDADPATGEYRIPHIIYSDAYFSEMVPYADLILPDTTYLERHDCISLLDRPIGDANGVADAIRQPVIQPDRDVRPFQDVLLDLGWRLKLPGLTRDDGSRTYPGGYVDYMVNHQRAPGVGLLAGWRGRQGDQQGKGEPNPDQLTRYTAHDCHWRMEFQLDQRYFKHANRSYLEQAAAFGWLARPDPIILQLYCEPLQTFRLAARGHGAVRPAEGDRERILAYFDPLPFWYEPLEHMATDKRFSLFAITQRPMAMYHSWGSQNAWLRQIHGDNRLYLNRRTATRFGIGDDDWIWITSPHGRVKAQVRLMEGVNESTVWTWNGVGKRKGSWNLDPDSPEATRGFLLNHLISELLPPRGDGYHHTNSDPVTGQAAWYDLRVTIEKAAEAETGMSAPVFAELVPPPGLSERPSRSRYGEQFRATAAPRRWGLF